MAQYGNYMEFLKANPNYYKDNTGIDTNTIQNQIRVDMENSQQKYLSKDIFFNKVDNYANKNGISNDKAFDIMLDNAINNGYVIEGYNDTKDSYKEVEQEQETKGLLSTAWDYTGGAIGRGLVKGGNWLQKGAKDGREEFGLKSKIADGEQGVLGTVGRTLGNFFLDVGEGVGGVMIATGQPIETVKGLYTGAEAGIETGLNKIFGTDVYTTEQKREIGNAISKYIGDRYDNPKIFLDDMVENPFDTMTLIGGALKTAGPKGSAVNKFGQKILDKQDELLELTGKPIDTTIQKVGGIKQGTSTVFDELAGTTKKQMPITFKQLQEDPKFLQPLLEKGEKVVMNEGYIQDAATKLKELPTQNYINTKESFFNKIEGIKKQTEETLSTVNLNKKGLDLGKQYGVKDKVLLELDGYIKGLKDYELMSKSQKGLVDNFIKDYIDEPNISYSKLNELKSDIGKLSTEIGGAGARVTKSVQDFITSKLKSDIPGYSDYAKTFSSNRKFLDEFTTKFFTKEGDLRPNISTELDNLLKNDIKLNQYSKLLGMDKDLLKSNLMDLQNSKNLEKILTKLENNKNITPNEEKLLKDFDIDFYKEYKSYRILDEIEKATDKIGTMAASAGVITNIIGATGQVIRGLTKLSTFGLLRKYLEKEARLSSKVADALKKLEKGDVSKISIIKQTITDKIRKATPTSIKAGGFMPQTDEENKP